MKYEINFYGLSYPVGEDIQRAKEFVNSATKVFKRLYQPKGVNIFCRGSSGAILATLFASKLPKNYKTFIIHIKKDGEWSHNTDSGLDRAHNGDINVIIDDIISSGETLREIYSKIQRNSNDTVVIDCLIVSNWSQGYIPQIKFTPVNVISR